MSKAQVMALAAGDAWLNNGAKLLLFGPPSGGKSHLAAALGFALVEPRGIRNGFAFFVNSVSIPVFIPTFCVKAEPDDESTNR